MAKDPVKNAKALLRIALPIDNKPIRVIQEELDSISEAIRIPGNRALGAASSAGGWVGGWIIRFGVGLRGMAATRKLDGCVCGGGGGCYQGLALRRGCRPHTHIHIHTSHLLLSAVHNPAPLCPTVHHPAPFCPIVHNPAPFSPQCARPRLC